MRIEWGIWKWEWKREVFWGFKRWKLDSGKLDDRNSFGMPHNVECDVFAYLVWAIGWIYNDLLIYVRNEEENGILPWKP